MLGTNFKSEFFTQKKANISHKYSTEMSGLEFNCKITFNNKFLNYAIFYSQLTQYVLITRFQFELSSYCASSHISQKMLKMSST